MSDNWQMWAAAAVVLFCAALGFWALEPVALNYDTVTHVIRQSPTTELVVTASGHRAVLPAGTYTVGSPAAVITRRIGFKEVCP